MRTSILSAFVLFAALTPCQAQTRQKRVAAADFPTLIKSASVAYESGQFSKAMAQLQAAMNLAAAALRKAVRAAMPAAPEGFKVRPPRDQDLSKNPFAAAIGATAVPIEHQYDGGRGNSIRVTCHVNSPMVKMMQMALGMVDANPKQEKIGYGDHQGILEDKGRNRYQLQIIIYGKHLVTVNTQGLADEQIFKMFNQAVVDKLAKLFGK